MPVISTFYGIVIRMYFFDTDRHKSPHVHVQYGEWNAVLGIPDGEVLDGEIKAVKLRLAQAWIEIHKEELMAGWRQASEGRPISKIEPLR